MKIQMLDLRAQYEHIKSEVDAEIQKVIESAEFIKKGKVIDFQLELAQYLGIKNVVPVGNGTDALQISLMALGLSPGDEVITPAFSFVAPLEAISFLGLKPVLVDVDFHSFNISIESLKKAITKRTRAIIPVHLFGQNCDMEAIKQLAKEHKLYVIEDACQSLGAIHSSSDGEKAQSGCIGDIGCTSFFPSKNLACFGDGGAIFCNDDLLAKKMRMLASHGTNAPYHHEIVGLNSRLDSIQAAVLSVKLKQLDKYIASRQKVANYYDAVLGEQEEIIIPKRNGFSTHSFHQYTLKLKTANRSLLQEKIKSKGVPSMIYYPIPLHLQKAYKHLGYKKGDFPVSEALCDSVLSLPMHTELQSDQLKHITNSVIDALKEKR